jgi:hypothetical protein
MSADVLSAVQSGRRHHVLGDSILARGAGIRPCVKLADEPHSLCRAVTESQSEESTASAR